MQRLSSIHFYKYIIIPLILAALLSFNCFAADSSPAFDILGGSRWLFYSDISTEYKVLYQYANRSTLTYNGNIIGSRVGTFIPSSTDSIYFRIPINSTGISDLTLSFYLALCPPDGTLPSDYALIDNITAISVRDFGDVAIPNLTRSYNTQPARSFFFAPSDTLPSGYLSPWYTAYFMTISIKSDSPIDVASIRISLDIPYDDSTSWNFMYGLVDDSVSSSDSALLNEGINGILTSINSMSVSMSESNTQISNQMDSITNWMDEQLVSSPESDQIVADSISKSEELNDLGDALAAVPKPSINNISNTIRPSYSMSVSNPQTVQSALYVIYSWDKFIAIIVLFGALGTISYILFGKKK